MEIDIGEIILEEEIEIGPLELEREIIFNPIEMDAIKFVVDDYQRLKNKPSINYVELINNKQLEDLNVNRLTNSEIENLIDSIVI